MLSVKSIYFRIRQFIKERLINKVIHGGNVYEIDMLYKELPKEEKVRVRAKMVEYYKRSDLNISDIAFKFRCSNETVRKALKDANVKADKFHSKLTIEEKIRILELNNSNMNTKVIAYNVGCCEKTVSKIINRYTMEELLQELEVIRELEENYIPVTPVVEEVPVEETPATEEDVRENLNNELEGLNNLSNEDEYLNNTRKRDEEEA